MIAAIYACKSAAETSMNDEETSVTRQIEHAVEANEAEDSDPSVIVRSMDDAPSCCRPGRMT